MMTRIDVGLMGLYSNCHAHKKLQEYELSQGHKKKTTHKNCKPKFNLKLKT
jgi:hypothetical protein